MTKNNQNLGIFSILLATFFFSLFGIFIRIISTSMGVFYQLVVRVLIIGLIFLIIGFLSKKIKPIKKEDYLLFLFRGSLVVIDAFCFYFAINNLPLGLTMFLFYGSSVASSFIYGSFFLKEKMNQTKIISLIFVFLGLFLIYSSDINNISIIPSIFALISGTCFGLITSTSNQLTNKYSVLQVNSTAYLISFFIGLIFLFLTKEPINLLLPFNIWLALFGFCLFVVASMYLTLYGFSKIEAQKGSLLLLFELVFVIIFGFFLYQEIPSTNSLIGGLLIVTALALPNIKFKKQILMCSFK